MHVHVLMRDEKEGTKKEDTSKQGQTNNKAKQHSIPKAVTFPKKNELGPEAMTSTLYTLDRVLYQLRYQGSSAGWAQPQISHVYTCTLAQ